jgi:hypothetical protein
MSVLRGIALVTALASVLSSPALAADPLPQPGCQGFAFEDGDADQTNVLVPAQFRTPSTEMTGGFLLYDEATKKTTFNIVVKDLQATVPTGFMSIAWQANLTTPDGTNAFIRALLDATGSIIYEWGAPDATLPVTRNVVQGTTTGKLFTGPNGVVQLDVPAALAPAGATLDNVSGTTYQSNASGPNAVPPTVSRGLSQIMDTTDSGVFTVGPCPPEEPGG